MSYLGVTPNSDRVTLVCKNDVKSFNLSTKLIRVNLNLLSKRKRIYRVH